MFSNRNDAHVQDIYFIVHIDASGTINEKNAGKEIFFG